MIIGFKTDAALAKVLGALVVLTAAGCDSPLDAPAGVSETLAAPQLVHGPAQTPLPFRVDLEVTADLLAPGEAGSGARCNELGLFTLFGSGEGTAAHLGRVAATFSNCTAFPIPGPVEVQEGEATFVAAGGDVLQTTYAGVQEAVDMATLTAGYSLEFEIEGGTGRFASASGAFSGGGTVNFAPDGVTTYSGEGWISFGASDRRP